MGYTTKKGEKDKLFFDIVRDGFFVPSMMQKWWALSMKNFAALDKECRKEGKNVLGMWGTMLGCIRYGGFVPWDDDIDTLVFRDTFNMLYDKGKNGELSGEYWISDYEFNKDGNMTRTWVDCAAVVRTMEGVAENYGIPLFNAIDIFIMDTLPRNGEERKAHKSIIETFIMLSEQAKTLYVDEAADIEGDDEPVDEVEMNDNIRKLCRITGIELEKNDDVPLFVRLYKAMDEYCSRFKQGQGDDISILSYYINYDGLHYDKRLFSACVEMPFEGGTMPLPIGYDEIARISYADHMCPSFAGATHDQYPIYEFMEQQMKEKINIEHYTYHYDEETYSGVMNGRNPKISVSDQVKDSIALFGDAHAFISGRCEAGEIDPTVLDVLGQCQDLAVSVGERVETDAVGGEVYVKEFENYCNDIYGLYQLVDACLAGSEVTVDELVNACNIIKKYENIFDEISEKITDKKEVVILCYRVENWKTFHTIYEELSKKEDVNTVVIRVPYYRKNYDGTVDKENMIIETEGYPEGISFTDYDKYDFENRHPDVIINQWAYDEYNESIYIHPYYFSSNLHKHTEKLVLVPPFVTRETNGGDKLWTALSKYLCMPGGMYADLIVAQSEQMAESYAGILDEFLCKELTDLKRLELHEKGDKNAAEAVVESQDVVDFKSKVAGSGSALYDWQSEKRTILHDKDNDIYYEKSGQVTTPEIYDDIFDISADIVEKMKKPDGSFRKIMAFFPCGSCMYTHGKPAVEKNRSEMLKAKDNDDILIWWFMDPYAREILKNHAKDVWVAFRAFRDEFEKEGYGILDESWDDTLIKNIADFMYGDGCPMMNYIREAGKPVLWATPAHPTMDPETHGGKKWTADLTVVHDRQWTMENFLEEAVKYEPPKPAGGNAARIVDAILK